MWEGQWKDFIVEVYIIKIENPVFYKVGFSGILKSDLVRFSARI